eukprot:SAG11_NODE_844_length_6891_cov_3.648704_2_plen_815_part_00
MTAAINYGSGGKECEFDCLTPTLDVIGMNYNWKDWDDTHANYSQVPMVSSEMTRSNSVRGVYDDLHQEGSGYYSVYSAAAGWLNSWRQINSRSQWLAGGFFWTGFDYIGEPRSPISVSSSFGAIDLCGFEKDSFYYFQSNWSLTPSVHLVPSHWNFAAGQAVEVWAFSGHCTTIELLLNGKPLQPLGASFEAGDIAMFGNVTWEHGLLEAHCKDAEMKTVASDRVQTAGEPAGIKLDVDYNEGGLLSDGSDVFLARVTVVDATGVMVPEGPDPHGPRQHVTFSVDGGLVYGVCNGDPTTKRQGWFESDKGHVRTTFNGLARVIVAANKSVEGGVVKLMADTDSSTGGGVFHAELSVQAHPARRGSVPLATAPSLPEPPVPTISSGLASTNVFWRGQRASDGTTYPCVRIPSIIRVAPDVLLAFAECRHSVGDGCYPTGLKGSGPRDICTRRSRDAGASWGDLDVLVKNAGQDTAVWDEVTQTVVLQFDGEGSAGRTNQQVLSTDMGLTYSAPQPQIGARSGASTGPGRGLQLSKTNPHAPSRLLFIGHRGAYVEDYIWYSDDNGKTFKLSTTPSGNSLKLMDEAQLVELKNGNVLASMRNRVPQTVPVPIPPSANVTHATCCPFPEGKPVNHSRAAIKAACEAGGPAVHYNKGRGTAAAVCGIHAHCDCCRFTSGPAPGPKHSFRAVSISTDGGTSFSNASFDRGLPEPVCMGSIISAGADGNIFFSNPGNFSGRMDGRVRRSRDCVGLPANGKCNWDARTVTIAQGQPFAYSCLTELNDTHVGLLWETNAPGCSASSSACLQVFSTLPLALFD